jgi:hypothetical protein
MRAVGVLESGQGYGLHDHVCCGFDDAAQMQALAQTFLADGLALGQRVGYIGGTGLGSMGHHLTEATQDLDPTASFVTDVAEMYRGGAVIDPDGQVAAYVAATEAAVRAGFTGLRVAADVTDLVRTDEQFEAFARYEHRVDRRMVDLPFTAMCAYSRPVLGDELVCDASCLHPVSNVDPPFSMHGSADATFCLWGEVDASVLERFRRSLGRVVLGAELGPVVVDATGLRFIDHRGVLALQEIALRHGRGLVVRSAGSGVARLTELLGIGDILVEDVA